MSSRQKESMRRCLKANGSFLLALGQFEAIAGAAHGLKIARILRVDLDFLTDAAHIDIDGAGRDEARIAPDRVEKVVAAEDAAGMARQIVEQPEFRGSGGGELAADLQLHGAGVDDDLFKADDRRRCGPLEAAQHSFDAGHQFARRKGLGDVVVRPQFEAENAIVFAGARGEKDDGNGGKAGVIAQAAANIETIAAGHHDVEQKKRGRLALGVGNEIGWGMKQACLKTCRFKVMLHQPCDIGVVFQNEIRIGSNRQSSSRGRLD